MEEEIGKAFGAVVEDIYSGLKSVAIGKKVAALNTARVGFRKLIDDSRQRRSTIKTLVDPNTPIDLLDNYVETNLSLSDKRVTEAAFLQNLAPTSRFVVAGTAGAGKSIFLKFLFLRYLDVQRVQIPLFIELRNVNEQSTEQGVLALILSHVQNYLPDFDLPRLKHGLHAGKFALFLDAIDEVDNELRPSVMKEILRIAEENRKAAIVCTSRPDGAFAAWEEFAVYKVEGLSQQNAVQLIEKTNYDPIIKQKFVDEVLASQFDAHREFLSVPLLLIMMLLVYDQFAEVPDKIVNFYRRAFETLFSRHDASKSGYKRKTHTGLALEDFERLFSAFCVSTYSHGLYTFPREVALSHAGKAIASTSLSVSADDVISDLLRSVCVLQQDGVDYAFVHRSFQEYFAALFLVRWPVAKEKRLDTIATLSRRHGAMAVFGMMRELEPAQFDREWLEPAASVVAEELPKFSLGKLQGAAALVDALYESFRIDTSQERARSYSAEPSRLGHFWNFLLLHGGAESEESPYSTGLGELEFSFLPDDADELCSKSDGRRSSRQSVLEFDICFAKAVTRNSSTAKSFARAARAQAARVRSLKGEIEQRVLARTRLDDSLI